MRTSEKGWEVKKPSLDSYLRVTVKDIVHINILYSLNCKLGKVSITRGSIYDPVLPSTIRHIS